MNKNEYTSCYGLADVARHRPKYSEQETNTVLNYLVDNKMVIFHLQNELKYLVQSYEIPLEDGFFTFKNQTKKTKA